MKTALHEDYNTLVRYLLGELDEAARERVAERYMFDPQYSELRDEVEMDLVDAYVAGTLAVRQRRHFEGRYLITTERKEMVRAAYLSKLYRDRLIRPAGDPAKFSWGGAPGWRWRRWAPVAAAAAVVVLAFIGGGELAKILRRPAGGRILSARNQIPPGPAVVETPREAPKAVPPKSVEAGTTRGMPAARPAPGTTSAPAPKPSVEIPPPPPLASQAAPSSGTPPEIPVPSVQAAGPGVGVVTRATPTRATGGAGHSAPLMGGGRAADSSPAAGNAVADQPALRSSGIGYPGTGKEAIQEALQAEYQLTKPTNDKTDIITAGSIVVLLKDKVLMVASPATANPCMNTYLDGKITPARVCGTGERIKRFGRFSPGSGSAPLPLTRNFVSGERFWVTKIDVKQNGVVFDFLTDPIDNSRYIGELTIPFGGSMPTPDEAVKLVAQVLGVVASPPDGSAAPTITLGATIDEVTGTLGQPSKIVVLGNKKTYIYRDLKVTFTDGKVTDVQ